MFPLSVLHRPADTVHYGHIHSRRDVIHAEAASAITSFNDIRLCSLRSSTPPPSPSQKSPKSRPSFQHHHHHQDPDPAPVPLETDPEEICELWKSVRSSSPAEPAPQEFDLILYAMASANKQLILPPNQDLQNRYGIQVLAPDYADTLWQELQCLPPNQNARESNVAVWEGLKTSTEMAEFQESADQVKNFTVEGMPFRCLYDFMYRKIFGAQALPRSDILLRYTYDDSLFKVSHPYAMPYKLPPPLSLPLQTEARSELAASSTTLQRSFKSLSETSQSVAQGPPKAAMHRAKYPGSSLPRPTTTSNASFPPTAAASSTAPEFDLPLSNFDLAYMISTEAFTQQHVDSKLFVTVRLPYQEAQATLPYLSVAFDDKLSTTPELLDAKNTRLRAKLIRYGSTALYNRFRLSQTALLAKNKKKQSSQQDDRVDPLQSKKYDMSFLHFGVTVIKQHVAVYVFRLRKGHKGGVVSWEGCTLNIIHTGDITTAGKYAQLVENLHLIHTWAAEVYVQGVQMDLERLG